MAITIAVETPLQDDVRGLVAELNAYLIPLTPREFQFQLTVEQMAEPSVTLFVARDAEGRSVGMGALKEHGDGLGEVKRMYTLPSARAGSASASKSCNASRTWRGRRASPGWSWRQARPRATSRPGASTSAAASRCAAPCSTTPTPAIRGSMKRSLPLKGRSAHE